MHVSVIVEMVTTSFMLSWFIPLLQWDSPWLLWKTSVICYRNTCSRFLISVTKQFLWMMLWMHVEQFNIMWYTISCIDRTLCCINRLGKRNASIQNLIQSDCFTYFTLQWHNNAYLLLQMSHVAAFKVCQKCHTLTFHWAITWIAQKCASGGDRITTVHGNRLSHRPRARVVIGKWKILVTECMFCVWKMNQFVLHDH